MAIIVHMLIYPKTLHLGSETGVSLVSTVDCMVVLEGVSKSKQIYILYHKLQINT